MNLTSFGFAPVPVNRRCSCGKFHVTLASGTQCRRGGNPMSEEKAKPFYSVRAGSINGALWLRKTKEGKAFLGASITHDYKKDDGTYAPSTSYDDRNLADLVLVATELRSKMRTSKVE